MKYQQEVQILDQFHHQPLLKNKIMEGGKPSPHSFHLKKVLKSYQLTAANTLSGPSSFLSTNGQQDPNAAAAQAQNSTTTPTPASNGAGNSTLIIKTNYVDPNGLIHNHHRGAKSGMEIVVDDEQEELQQVYLRQSPNAGNQFSQNFGMSSSSDSTSTSSSGPSSTSASPISHHGEAAVLSPPPAQPQPPRGIKSERTSPPICAGGRKSSCGGGQITPLPKKLMHRHSSPPIGGGLKEEQQRSLQAALILASGLHPKKLYELGDHQNHGMMTSMQPPPILSASDRSTTEKRETPLEGVFISCFVVGGEKRLCFPHILTTVLKPFSLPQINQVCDELQIFCSRCSPEQLEVLKVTGVLPMGAHSCGLITKTDAERLVNALLHRNPPKAAVGSVAARSGAAAASSSNNAFRVYHKCFGKCKGIVLSNLYDRMDSLCIECVECHGLFSPARFVAHSHHRQEVRTCHWGFDSSKWRHYLLLARDEEPEKWAKSLAEFKGKFEQKRKESAASSSCDESYGGWNGDEHLVIKRVRYSSGVDTPLVTSPTNVVTDPAALYLPKKRLSSSYNIQYSDNKNNDQNYVNETDAVKKMLLSQLGSDGADPVIQLLDKLTGKISSLEKICRSQDHQLRRSEPNQHQNSGAATDLQRKVNTMEAELHSLKKQLLRRHEAR